jgi:hypothetical protein
LRPGGIAMQRRRRFGPGAPVLHFSRRVDVVVWPLQRIAV